MAKLQDMTKTLRDMTLRGCALMAVIVVAVAAQARTAADFFIDAPDDVVSLLPRNSRLDMVDYFNFGSRHTTANITGGEAIVKRLTERVAEIVPDDDVNIQIALLVADGDTTLAVSTTLRTPFANSDMRLFNTDWTPVGHPAFQLPSYGEWLSEEGVSHEEELRMEMPFMPVSALFNDSATVLTLSNEAPYYLSDDDYDTMKPFLLGSRVYDIDGSNFLLRNQNE